jgi:rare lipoprotein A
MLSNRNMIMLALLPALALSGCGHNRTAKEWQRGRDGQPIESAPPIAEAPPLPADEASAKVGDPYEVKGESITPANEAQYDEVGYGSWYGPEMEGRQTGNGENYNPAGISAAHKTLPMPSYVEVTNLDTGKTILARVNDRGPFAANRIIDLSQGAAQQLGVEGQGNFPVRVRRVNPPEQEKDVLRSGGRAVERIETPPALLTALRKHLPGGSSAAATSPKPPITATAPSPRPKPALRAPAAPAPPRSGGDRFVVEGVGSRNTAPASGVAPRPATPRPAPVSSGQVFVQIGSFADVNRAKALAKTAGGRVQAAGNVYRVLKGPYPSEEDARAALPGLAAKGYRGARISR